MKRRQFLQYFSIGSVSPAIARIRPEPDIEDFDRYQIFQYIRIPVCDGDTISISNGETQAIYKYRQPSWYESGDLVHVKPYELRRTNEQIS